MTPLRAERERRGLTAASVAESVGATQSHYSKVEKALSAASPDLANRLSKFFGNAVTRDQILYPLEYGEKMEGLRKPVRSRQLLQEAS